MKLEGKVAFVSGAGSGLGRAMAQTFAAEGARVAVNDLRPETADETRAMLAGEGHVVVAGDVSDSTAVNAWFATIEETYGRLDVLVNNAGVDKTPDDGWDQMLQGELQVLHMSDAGFRRMLDIHLAGAFYCIRAGLPLMLRGGNGSIINISSIAGLAGYGQYHYSTAKGGLLGMTRALARDVGPRGVRVNAICPGVIRTPMTNAVPEEMLAPMIAMTPMRRAGVPDDIAACALYLASDDSSFVTGHAISPNGGFHIF